jgi:hypothetical protein
MYYKTFSISGTCINNTSVMMFKKGSFENSSTIHPVAIKVSIIKIMPRLQMSMMLYFDKDILSLLMMKK